jgi:hypothetical protein
VHLTHCITYTYARTHTYTHIHTHSHTPQADDGVDDWCDDCDDTLVSPAEMEVVKAVLNLCKLSVGGERERVCVCVYESVYLCVCVLV